MRLLVDCCRVGGDLPLKGNHCPPENRILHFSPPVLVLCVLTYFWSVLKLSQFLYQRLKLSLFLVVENQAWNSELVVDELSGRSAQVSVSPLDGHEYILLTPARLVRVNEQAHLAELTLDLRNRGITT